MNDKWIIEFNFPDSEKVWAGLCRDGGWGFAPQRETAHFFIDRQGALNILNNAYGKSMSKWGHVVAVSQSD